MGCGMPLLDRPLEVTGPIELRLFVASSASDTDFTGKLVDIYPDGPGHPGGTIVSESADQYIPAINRIFHDAAHRSRLTLPVIAK